MTDSNADELRSLGQRVYDAINAQDLATLERLFTPDVVRHAMGEVGFEAARRAVTGLFATAPDTRFQVEDLVADGDRVALRVTVHQGAPDPGTVPQAIMEIFRIEHGRVAEIWGAGTPARPVGAAAP
ncbi:MAG TPA: nuclear transport factor 2 family protein [Acidimicrobiales bacterium]|jgi:predicted ester cyclase|nr:nuclear transport factor 2 family protein [Acidimicrobiales bacterium]